MHRVALAQCRFIKGDKKNLSEVSRPLIKTTKKEAQTLKEALRDIQPLQKQKDDDMTITQMHPRKDTCILTLTPKKTKNPKFGEM